MINDDEYTTFAVVFLLQYLNLLFLSLHELGVKSASNYQPRKRTRTPDSHLPYSRKRKRQPWSPLSRELGEKDFVIHHRLSETLFRKIHRKIQPHIRTQRKYIRSTCCRGDPHVDSRSRLSMTLKFLAGSKMQDITRCHGVSRPTALQSIRSTLTAILKEFPLDPFPFDDVDKLQEIADGFKKKSSGGLFTNVVGALDGYLLKIHKRCIGKRSGIQNPTKFYCRKNFLALNCQVCCDANRKVRFLSILSPGAVPDLLAFVKTSLNSAVETGQLPDQFHFIGDNAYPRSNQILVPCTRSQLRSDINGQMDNYNYYLSQLRINIECTFGMIVAKFPILQAALPTAKLQTAIDIMHVCCILHNLCIDERLSNANKNLYDTYIPPLVATRLRQVGREQYGRVELTHPDDFEETPLVNETMADNIIATDQIIMDTDIDVVDNGHHEDSLSTREKLILKIAASGYVRPRKIHDQI